MDESLEVGWYRDPCHPVGHRFWDGERWQSQGEHLYAGAADDTVVARAGEPC